MNKFESKPALTFPTSNDKLNQWSSVWAKSFPGGRFYALWGRFCDLRDLGGDFCR